MILNYNEWVESNEAKKFIIPSKENEKITDLVKSITSDHDFDFTKKDLEKKSQKYQDIRDELDKQINKKELKRIELKYNSFDRFLNDLILELNPDLD